MRSKPVYIVARTQDANRKNECNAIGQGGRTHAMKRGKNNSNKAGRLRGLEFVRQMVVVGLTCAATNVLGLTLKTVEVRSPWIWATT
jgi:hypothetical protein